MLIGISVSCNVDHLPFQLWVTSLPHVPEGGSPATTRTRFAYVKELAIATPSTSAQRTVVLEVDGLHWASEKNAVEAVLGRRPGVTGVEANPVAQTATVTYDPARTTVEALAG